MHQHADKSGLSMPVLLEITIDLLAKFTVNVALLLPLCMTNDRPTYVP